MAHACNHQTAWCWWSNPTWCACNAEFVRRVKVKPSAICSFLNFACEPAADFSSCCCWSASSYRLSELDVGRKLNRVELEPVLIRSAVLQPADRPKNTSASSGYSWWSCVRVEKSPGSGRSQIWCKDSVASGNKLAQCFSPGTAAAAVITCWLLLLRGWADLPSCTKLGKVEILLPPSCIWCCWNPAAAGVDDRW